MNVHIGLFGFGLYELPDPDARTSRRHAHDTIVDRRPHRGSRIRKRRATT